MDQPIPKSTGVFLAAARAILAEAGHPLHSSEITERALTAGLVQTSGKTPAATMAAQLYTNLKKHGPRSAFVLVGKGRFGLRAWSADDQTLKAPSSPTGAPPEPMPPVVQLAQDPVDRVVAELLTAQHESFDSVRFEIALTAALAFLGFAAHHVGGPGQTDILVDAPITGSSYRVIVDAKSNKNAKVADHNIDWNSLADHRKAAEADHILVVAPGFGGGNLLKRADDYGVALLTAEEIAELVRLHHNTPFTLLELRALVLTPGRAIPALEQLRQVATVTRSRWRLLRQIVDLVSDLPTGAYPDTQNLWLLLSYQQKQNAPTLDDVADAVTILASRALGILKPNNGGFILTMQAETALNRLMALTRTAVADASTIAQTPLDKQSTSLA